MTDLVKRLRDAAVIDKGYGPCVRMDLFDYGTVHEIADRIEALEAALRKAQEALTPSADTKAAYMSEFTFEEYVDEEYVDTDERREFTVPWTTIKEIMKAISARAEIERMLK